MTIFLTMQEFLDQFQEADKEELSLDVSDKLDVTWKIDQRIGQVLRRNIELREGGIFMLIEKAQNYDRLVLNTPEFKTPLQWHFFLSGKQQITYSSYSHKPTDFSLDTGKYVFRGHGLANQRIDDCSDTEPFLEVEILVQPEVLRSFMSDSAGELPKIFNHLVQSANRECYKRTGKTPSMVNAILQQIIQCPYQGLTKRIYLESKATEIMALMLEEEAAIQQGEFKASILQPDQLDRIHYAQEIILKNLSNPPSLMELARQVGMCDYNLKRGFKEVFGTTVFGYLRDRRLEKAQQLLLERNMTVASVARAVGYESHASFTTAFKRQYGVSPKAYQMSIRK